MTRKGKSRTRSARQRTLRIMQKRGDKLVRPHYDRRQYDKPQGEEE